MRVLLEGYAVLWGDFMVVLPDQEFCVCEGLLFRLGSSFACFVLAQTKFLIILKNHTQEFIEEYALLSKLSD